MQGRNLISRLRSKYDLRTISEVAAFLGMTPANLTHWQNRKEPLSATQIERAIKGASEVAVKKARSNLAKELIDDLKKKNGLKSDDAVAASLNMTPQRLSNWKNQDQPLTAKKISSAIKGASDVAVERSYKNIIRPIVEFFPIEPTKTNNTKRFRIVPEGDSQNDFYTGLRNELSESQGIYIFYDTRVRVIYAGKTERRNLWDEMSSAFTRTNLTQPVRRIHHRKDGNFNPAYERPLQPTIQPPLLHLSDFASYFSAFKIAPKMISNLEALLVRGFANDLLNKRMETFNLDN